MCALSRYYKNRISNNGFTLIELLVGISICSILIVSFYSVYSYCINSSRISEEKEDRILNGRYAIEYIKNEIKSADEIISIEKIENYNKKYSKNFGFVIKKKIEIGTDKKGVIEREYENKYIIYYINENYLRRDVATKKTENLPYQSEFEGNNTIVGNIKSIDKSYTDFDRKIIVISLIFNGEWSEELEFNTEIGIRAPINN
ncbi:PilW family protein [Anaerosalibacter sp. Marseille-P3206]|uniref:PilW family protein n=1 Tax=Anaerosalibacter sp. Marseille-P3206 TaxID=1871005 RepID=UPI000986FE91|nr:prepilin-type N-terminal cleavage/methylation domain-containing protein [Anaerosalibacter sp. Marseille-P3206]